MSSSSAAAAGARECPETRLPPVHTLFVWDFDWTIANCNSDEYVPSKFLGDAATARRLRQLLDLLGPGKWHECVSSLVNACIEERDVSQREIVEAAACMPYLNDVRMSLQAIDNDARMGQAIISDGNDVFIGAFLHKNGMDRYFTHGIETNIGGWEGAEEDANNTRHGVKFSVTHQSSKYGGHSCTTCPPNLCKSQVLELDIMKRIDRSCRGNATVKRPRIVYVGDGANDACPALHVLKEGDVLLARDGQRLRNPNARTGPQDETRANDLDPESRFAIASTLKRAKAKKGLLPKCHVHAWNSGQELHALVQNILDGAHPG